MLETRNLTKIYRPKKGVPVKAINNLSIKFADTGMVFLLGKSGSGKSTLLNLLGGLDRYNSGEIIIKGVSSKRFKQTHFDSYRNTYVGFIFQEYNILEDFTVGANIALAIELQGRKASNNEINQILKDVDLEGFGHRRPNELSGGQKQRVAIARALVKNPKIIMADEPTGALDSETGKQVLETLKKLSKEKLVIVVSHDRDFASKYADRIVELADGSIISDTTVVEDANENLENSGISFSGNTAQISKDYRLTEADRIAINNYLDSLEQGGELLFTETVSSTKLVATNQDEIVSKDTTPFKLIKSKLALRHAFKIGASGLKHKKIRLAFTIILSCVAFTLFGLSDTFGAYNHINACTESIIDSGIKYAAISKEVLYDEEYDIWDTAYLTEADLYKVSSETGIALKPVVSPLYDINFLEHIANQEEFYGKTYYNIYSESFSGAVEINQNELKDMGFKVVAGKMPEKGKNQVAISAYIAETFKKYGFAPNGNFENSPKLEINSYSDLIGLTLKLECGSYQIAAVIDTNFNLSRYNLLSQINENSPTEEILVATALYSELAYEQAYSYAGLLMLPQGDLQAFSARVNTFVSEKHQDILLENENYFIDPFFFTTLNKVDPAQIIWISGEKTTLANNEVIVSQDLLEAQEYYDENGNFIGFNFANLTNETFTLSNYAYMSGETETVEGFKIVGVYNTETAGISTNSIAILSNSNFNKFINQDGDYSLLIGQMPKDSAAVKSLVSYCYAQNSNIQYPLNNPVSFELDALNTALKIIGKIFLWIGVFFALFAAVLLSNFIATSISYKKQEIGILRAIGSRSNDVFRIFFAESFIIALINFVLSSCGVFAITTIINLVIRNNMGLLITVLNFGIRQVALIFIISVLAAFIASFLPVKKIASKRPIDAIKNR